MEISPRWALCIDFEVVSSLQAETPYLARQPAGAKVKHVHIQLF